MVLSVKILLNRSHNEQDLKSNNYTWLLCLLLKLFSLRSSDSQLLEAAASRARDLGINIIAVGVAEYSERELLVSNIKYRSKILKWESVSK